MYTVRLSEQAVKAVGKLDKGQRKIIAKWIEKNLEGTEDPAKP
jgi:mRNA-degrading endonuclease RelE of RelBE toxin-antitoxin system